MSPGLCVRSSSSFNTTTRVRNAHASRYGRAMRPMGTLWLRFFFQSGIPGVGNLTISATNIIGAAYRNAHASRYGDEDWGAKKRPQPPLGKLRPIILARTYSHTECYRTTIGGWGLNERVRNGNGCFPPPMFTRVTLTFSRVTGGRLHVLLVMVRV